MCDVLSGIEIHNLYILGVGGVGAGVGGTGAGVGGVGAGVGGPNVAYAKPKQCTICRVLQYFRI